MNQDQLKGMTDRTLSIFIAMLLGWMVRKGWLGESDAATLTPALVLVPSLAYAWWRNRDTSLLQSAAAVVGPQGQKTLVVAAPELAGAVPEANVVSSTSVEVKSK